MRVSLPHLSPAEQRELEVLRANPFLAEAVVYDHTFIDVRVLVDQARTVVCPDGGHVPFDSAQRLARLAAAYSKRQLVPPIAVTPLVGAGRYLLLDGAHRVLAAEAARLSRLPSLVLYLPSGRHRAWAAQVAGVLPPDRPVPTRPRTIQPPEP